MKPSYRTREFLRRAWRFLLVLLLVAAVLLLCYCVWLRRFIVYTGDGIRLDFSLSQTFPQGKTEYEKQETSLPDIYFNQPETVDPDLPTSPTPSGPEDDTPITDPDRFVAYEVTLEELLNERELVLTRILALPEGTPVMLDVRGYWGNFYYGSALGSCSGSFDAATMDAFFAAVNESGVYAIARLPAFRNYNFALNNTACGLQGERGYLWVDSGRCYWLDPGNDFVLEHLAQVIRELRDLGFDEVAFTEFCFPDTDEVVYIGDRQQTITQAAADLAAACAREDFAISFITTDPTFPLPEGNCRLYLTDVAAADVAATVAQMSPGVAERTVFFTLSSDTRFDDYGVIRPLVLAD